MCNRGGFYAALLLVFTANGLKMTMELGGLEKQCFYEVFGQSQKYSLETIPKNEPKYELEISQSSSGAWATVYYKMAQMGYERMEVHKLSTIGTTYSFCIKNIQREPLQISVKFQSGIGLMQFSLLPQKSDAENLEREIKWLEDQKSNLYKAVSKVEESKSLNKNNSQILSKKMIVCAILGLIAILVVNYLFFIEVKKTFAQRKLI